MSERLNFAGEVIIKTGYLPCEGIRYRFQEKDVIH